MTSYVRIFTETKGDELFSFVYSLMFSDREQNMLLGFPSNIAAISTDKCMRDSYITN